MRRAMATLVVAVVALAGCGWPRDVSGTLDSVRGGVLRVGITENPPWTTAPAGEVPPSGAEVRLVDRLAERLGARVEWFPGSESALMAALSDRVLDLVIGGLDAKAPWTEQASLTRPYVTMRTVVAVPAGVPAPAALAGVRVAVPAGTAEVAALVGAGAVPVPVAEVTGREGLPVVVGQWWLAVPGLRPTGHDLAKHDHVWAVPPGENGWQAEVERFLLALTHDEVAALLAEAERARAAS